MTSFSDGRNWGAFQLQSMPIPNYIHIPNQLTDKLTMGWNNAGDTCVTMISNKNVYVYVKHLKGDQMTGGSGMFADQAARGHIGICANDGL